MKKLFPLVLGLALLVSLSACSAATDADASQAVREKYSAAWQCEAAVTADFGDRLGEYRLRMNAATDGSVSVEVVEPAVIAGLTAHLAPNSAQLEYDDVILETGVLPGSGLTPMDALPVLLRTWQSGYPTSVGEERVGDADCWHITYSGGTGQEQLEYQTWFDKATLAPVQAETFADGTRIIKATFER